MRAFSKVARGRFHGSIGASPSRALVTRRMVETLPQRKRELVEKVFIKKQPLINLLDAIPQESKLKKHQVQLAFYSGVKEMLQKSIKSGLIRGNQVSAVKAQVARLKTTLFALNAGLKGLNAREIAEKLKMPPGTIGGILTNLKFENDELKTLFWRAQQKKSRK